MPGNNTPQKTEAKGQAFAELHASGTFVIPNPWDAGSARILEGLGAKALATTSSGYAETLGRLDGQVSFEEKIEHCRALAAVTEVPISADLENGFAHPPEAVAANITRVGETGVVGGSIEDYDGEGTIYPMAQSVERVQAAVEAAAALPFTFTLTARAENLLHGITDLDDTIKRLQAYSAAGADVLYAPGLRTLEDVATVLAEVDKPINVLGPFFMADGVGALAELGVRRVSIGGALANTALGTVISASRSLLDDGSFEWLSGMASRDDLGQLLGS